MSGQESTGGAGKRAWLAVLLSLLVPGAGHLYLREWIRAAFWFLSILLVGQLALPPGAVSGEEFSLDALLGLVEAIPLWAELLIVGLTAVCMVDAYWLASRSGAPATTSPTGGDDADGTRSCPNCGKDVDEDLDFCHWCTTELPTAEADNAE